MPANLENSSGHKTGKSQFSFQSQRRAMPKKVQTTTQLYSFHMLARPCSKSFKLGFNSPEFYTMYSAYKLNPEFHTMYTAYKLNKQSDNMQPWRIVPNLEPAYCSMSSCTCCFLTFIQVSQEIGKVVWYFHFFKDFPQFVVIHTVKGFWVFSEAEVDVFPEFSCFFLWSNGCWQFDLWFLCLC